VDNRCGPLKASISARHRFGVDKIFCLAGRHRFSVDSFRHSIASPFQRRYFSQGTENQRITIVGFAPACKLLREARRHRFSVDQTSNLLI
jgi:hypothetical protein